MVSVNSVSVPVISVRISVLGYFCPGLDGARRGIRWQLGLWVVGVAPNFRNKTRNTPYVSLGSQISHIAINKGNIKRQCSIYNILSIKNITLDSKQRKDNFDLWGKTLIHRDN